MDELSITGKSLYWEVKNGEVTAFSKPVIPGDFGLKRSPLKGIQGDTPAENAEILHRVLSGEKGAKRDVVILNAAAALMAGDKDVGKIAADFGAQQKTVRAIRTMLFRSKLLDGGGFSKKLQILHKG
jgi:anthranilate phosphoribosyltransferase